MLKERFKLIQYKLRCGHKKELKVLLELLEKDYLSLPKAKIHTSFVSSFGMALDNLMDIEKILSKYESNV